MDDRKLRFISLGVGILVLIMLLAGLSQWLSGKEFACNSGDAGRHGSIPGSERSLERVHSSSIQYSFLENPVDRGTWRATLHRVTKS